MSLLLNITLFSQNRESTALFFGDFPKAARDKLRLLCITVPKTEEHELDVCQRITNKRHWTVLVILLKIVVSIKTYLRDEQLRAVDSIQHCEKTRSEVT